MMRLNLRGAISEGPSRNSPQTARGIPSSSSTSSPMSPRSSAKTYSLKSVFGGWQSRRNIKDSPEDRQEDIISPRPRIRASTSSDHPSSPNRPSRQAAARRATEMPPGMMEELMAAGVSADEIYASLEAEAHRHRNIIRPKPSHPRANVSRKTLAPPANPASSRDSLSDISAPLSFAPIPVLAAAPPTRPSPSKARGRTLKLPSTVPEPCSHSLSAPPNGHCLQHHDKLSEHPSTPENTKKEKPPTTPEEAEKVAAKERRRTVRENFHLAMDVLPEAFARVQMLYVPCLVNGESFAAFVDTGAQMSILSRRAAEKAKLDYIIDHRYGGTARGVGAAPICGRIHCTDLVIAGSTYPCAFTVIEQSNIDVILGLDMLLKHECDVDLRRHRINIAGKIVPFMSEGEMEEMKRKNGLPDLIKEKTATTPNPPPLTAR